MSCSIGKKKENGKTLKKKGETLDSSDDDDDHIKTFIAPFPIGSMALYTKLNYKQIPTIKKYIKLYKIYKFVRYYYKLINFDLKKACYVFSLLLKIIVEDESLR